MGGRENWLGLGAEAGPARLPQAAEGCCRLAVTDCTSHCVLDEATGG